MKDIEEEKKMTNEQLVDQLENLAKISERYSSLDNNRGIAIVKEQIIATKREILNRM